MVVYKDFNKVTSDKYGLLDHGIGQFKTEVAVPAGTAAGTRFRAFRFDKGFSLPSFQTCFTQLDTGSNLKISVGYVYDAGQTDDAGVALVDDEDHFLSQNTSLGRTAGKTSFAYPSNGSSQNVGDTFTAEGAGYIVVEITAGPTTTAGTIKIDLQYSYNQG